MIPDLDEGPLLMQGEVKRTNLDEMTRRIMMITIGLAPGRRQVNIPSSAKRPTCYVALPDHLSKTLSSFNTVVPGGLSFGCSGSATRGEGFF